MYAVVCLVLSELSKCTEQLAVLIGQTDGNTQAVLAERKGGTISDSDAFALQVAMHGRRIIKSCQEEVAFGREHLFAASELEKCSHDASFLFSQVFYPFVNVIATADDVKGLCLGFARKVMGCARAVKVLRNGRNGQKKTHSASGAGLSV